MLPKMNVQLFVPCFVDQLYPTTAFNVIKLLETAGCTVTYNTSQTCCGQPAYNAGFLDEAKAVATKFMTDFAGTDYIVTPSASCTGFVKNYYPGLFTKEADKLHATTTAVKIFELSSFLTDILKFENFNASLITRATYHDSCAALRECNIKEGPRRLLANVNGLEMVEMSDNETCCGFGGTFAVKFGAISQAMAEQKIQHALDAKVDCIISTDLSCLMQLDGYIKKAQIPIQTMHIADVLASGW